ncbi:MAG: 23S rRNA methyltransferase [Nitriliruptor sp.]|nr:MAG: 23S rRNA methyltransferase [Nitriliruptor sp.]
MPALRLQEPLLRVTLPEPAPLLRCPVCGLPLHRVDRAWRCEAGHCFDIARQGYVNLLTGRAAHVGDTATMLDARAAVLAAGHLDVVTRGVIDALADDLPAGVIVEAGAGTAHHLAEVARALPSRSGVALDASVAAAKRAAAADRSRITSVVADVWQDWPLLDGVAAAVLSIFAPRNLSETARVLVPGGRLVVVAPAQDHLHELRASLGLLEIEAGKQERLVAEAAPHLQFLDRTDVRTTRTVDRATARAIAAMGPSGFHLDDAVLRGRAARLSAQTETTIAVTVTRFVRA